MEVVGPTSSVNPPKQPLHVSDGLEQGRLEGGGGDEFDDKEISTKKTSASVLTSLFWTWANECAWPGMGLFGESYLLFSVGTLVPIWSRLYPPCQEDNDDDDDNEVDCVNRHLFESTTYTVVIGVILGMIVLGHLSNRIGRRKGSIATASFMAASAVGLTLATLIVEDANALFITMNALLFLFGFGVGGEYPLSASSASEKAMGIYHHRLEQELQQQQRHRKQSSNSALAELANKANVTDPTPPPQANHLRGQKVQLVFMMQGLGILVNSITLSCLLMAFGQWTEKDYKASSLLWIWRITYGIGALVLMYVLVSRILYLEESKAWLEDKEQREQQKQQQLQDEASNQSPKGTAALREPIPMVAITSSVSELSAPSVVFNHTDEYDLWKDGTRPGGSNLFRGDDSTTTKQSPFRLLLRRFGMRLFGSSMAWLLWDVAFYGNKLFQSTFLVALIGQDWTLLEMSLAATLNAVVAQLGYVAAALSIDDPSVGRVRLQQYGFFLTGTMFLALGFFYEQLPSAWLFVLYFGSSFTGQCGPNATTFVISAEIFPTEVRTLCHGIAAASGKVGALLAAILFHRLGNAGMFLCAGYAAFGAAVITFWTLPDVTQLDLYELDRQWRLQSEYKGEANQPQYLSYYERTVQLGLPY